MKRLSLATTDWQFRDCAGHTWLPAVVPGCVHADLWRAKRIPDLFFGANENALQWIEERAWEYRAQFVVTDDLLAEEQVELVADGLDTVATVLLNGREIGRGDNMFVGHRWAVKSALRPGRNELRVRFGSALQYIRDKRRGFRPREFNDPIGRSQVIRKQQCQFGWDWGPRFVTAGIWRDLRVEAWSGNRLKHLRITQEHEPAGPVWLHLQPELVRKSSAVRCRWRLALNGISIVEGSGNAIRIEHPQLWWPNGHGAQPLYLLEVEVSAGAAVAGRWMQPIGLRTIALDRRPDAEGETFRFAVNGRPIFAKGANWIPAHAFVAGLTREAYARDLRAAAAANMNMVRVWGGGIYESEAFYDLCDELGLLVWQDFMFACAIHPGDAAFARSVRIEAEQQVARLQHRACLALWCGNNEIFSLNGDLLRAPKLRRDYERIFHDVLPAAVAKCDGVTAYWPSSPWRGDDETGHAAGEMRGDTHFWDVWHARKPVKDYEKWRLRFVSEFGMQSYSSAATNATFCRPGHDNIFGPEMESHQKNRAGNQIILDYVSRRYRFPKSQDDLIYLSQLNQAHCMQTGVEHYRRLMPHCMGALYWQLNDCWPVASWSSIEFTGRWKALHHVARRFFAPALVTAHVPGDEWTIIGNYRRSTVDEVHLYTVYDAPMAAKGELRWSLLHLDGRGLLSGRKRVGLHYGESVRQKTLSLGKPLDRHGREHIVLRIALWIGGRPASEDTVFFAPPRFVELSKGVTKTQIKLTGPRRAQVTFESPVFQHRFVFAFKGIPHQPEDNYFELYPGEARTVGIELPRPQPLARLRQALTFHSLVDTY